MRWIDARPGIAHCHKDARAVLLGANQQLSCLCLRQAHCFDRVQEQVQDHLLQLNPIALQNPLLWRQRLGFGALSARRIRATPSLTINPNLVLLAPFYWPRRAAVRKLSAPKSDACVLWRLFCSRQQKGSRRVRRIAASALPFLAALGQRPQRI